jgi:hypothetical protein
MALPTASVTNTFAEQEGSIPLSQLDTDFADIVAWSNTIAPALSYSWCNWNGTATGTISANLKYNVSSVVRTGTGTYVITFATPTTTSVFVSMGNSGGGFAVTILKTTAAVTLAMYAHDGTAVDNAEASFVAFST